MPVKIRQAGWILPFAVAGVVAALPALRHQALLQWAMLPRPGVRSSAAPAALERDPILSWAVASSNDALEFAQRRHPDDADMLIAAAALTPDGDSARRLLAELAARDGRPVTWAAYVDSLLESGPHYYREETAGVDPDSAPGMAEVRRIIEERNLRTVLVPGGIAPVMDAVRSWQQAEPGNALPLAIEAWGLYGLHQDADAFERWVAASRLPRVSAWASDRTRSVSRLLASMGMPKPEAVLAARPAIRTPSLGRLRECAFAAHYAGHSAEAAGDRNEALRRWQASIDLGRHAQDSADTVSTFMAGVEVESIGASPVWVWRSDAVTGLRTRGGAGGRFFFGPHHDLYVNKVGQAADRELVGRLAAADKQTRMVDAAAGRIRVAKHYARAVEFLVFGQMVAGFAVSAGLVLVFSLLLLPRSAGGHGIPAIWGAAIALTGVVALAAAAGIVLAYAPMFPFAPLLAPTAVQLAIGIACPLFLAAGLSLMAAARHRPSLGVLTRWAATLRGALAFTVLLASLLYLVLGLAAMNLRGRFLRPWQRPGVTEMHLIAGTVGPLWSRPHILPDAWTAQDPPSSSPQARQKE